MGTGFIFQKFVMGTIFMFQEIVMVTAVIFQKVVMMTVLIFQEIVMGGMVVETNQTEILTHIEAQQRIEKQEAGKTYSRLVN